MIPVRRLSCALRYVCCALACLVALPVQAADSLPEYEVKAAMLYKIARFVEWPAGTFDSGELRLCVLGDDPFGERIDQLVGKTVNGHSVRVERARNPASDLSGCHVAFISSADISQRQRWLRAFEGAPVLTVGDRSGFGHDGGTINLLIRDKHVRFEINVAASERAGLKISSQLLQLATIVDDGSAEGEG